jgi:outer membrane protein assembly factor BamB
MRKKFVLVIMILLGAVLLSACVGGGGVRGTSWPGLAADEKAAYLADGSFVYAINLTDGKLLWQYPGTRNSKLTFYAPPVVTPDGLLVIGGAGTDYSLIAINPNAISPDTKAPVEVWKFTGAHDHWVAAPLVLNNKLFAVNSDGNLYVLDLQDGQPVKEATVVKLGGRLWAQPITDGERIYITSLDHSVTAVDANTYRVLWHENLGGAVPGSAVIGGDGMLYVGSLASQLEKFDPLTGKHQAVVDAENWVWSTPLVNQDALYFSDVDGNFYSFNTATGKLNWNPIKPDGPITASPLIQNDRVLLASESGSVFALDANGDQIWTQEVGGKIYTTPVAAGDLILVAPLETDFYLVALNQSGGISWKFTIGK